MNLEGQKKGFTIVISKFFCPVLESFTTRKTQHRTTKNKKTAFWAVLIFCSSGGESALGGPGLQNVK